MIDMYQKGDKDPRTGIHLENYEPQGHNRFAEDALILRHFWNSLTDYPNLDFRGAVTAGPGRRQMVLSSCAEALVYLASGLSDIGTQYPATTLKVADLALNNGTYEVAIWRPIAPGGRIETIIRDISGGRISIDLPSFEDDLMLHISERSPSQ